MILDEIDYRELGPIKKVFLHNGLCINLAINPDFLDVREECYNLSNQLNEDDLDEVERNFAIGQILNLQNHYPEMELTKDLATNITNSLVAAFKTSPKDVKMDSFAVRKINKQNSTVTLGWEEVCEANAANIVGLVSYFTKDSAIFTSEITPTAEKKTTKVIRALASGQKFN